MNSNFATEWRVPEEATFYKDQGAGHVKNANFVAALDSYQQALHHVCSKSSSPSPLPTKEKQQPLLYWPEHERFVVTLYSNMALCYLKLNRPQEAADICFRAKSMPVFAVNIADDLRQKIIARRMDALIQILQQEQQQQSSSDHSATTSDSNTGTKEEIESIMDEVRLRGYLTDQTNVSLSMRRTFFQLAQNLGDDSPLEASLPTEKAFEVWTLFLVRKQIISAGKASLAQTTLGQAAEKIKERKAFSLLTELLPKPAKTVDELNDILAALLSPTIEISPTDAAAKLRSYMQSSNLHPCATDQFPSASLMCTLCQIGLPEAPYCEMTQKRFLALFRVLVDEVGISVNQRFAQTNVSCSRTPLQYAARFGISCIVATMLELGAMVNLRDEEGWTALTSLCTDDKNGEDRLETARLLLDARADIHAETWLGFTPLLSLCLNPSVGLLKLLLERGANPNHVTAHGRFAAYYLKKRGPDECRRLLQAAITAHEDDPSSSLLDTTRKFQDLIALGEAATNDYVAKRNTISPDIATSIGNKDRAMQELAILSALFRHVGMNPGVLTRSMQEGDGNWLETFHTRVHSMVPTGFLKVYGNQERPTDLESKLMVSQSRKAAKAGEYEDSNGVRRFDLDKALDVVLCPFRDRGLVLEGDMDNFLKSVVNPVQHTVGFAVPDEKVLQSIARHAPLIEVGAGTGYWSALLQTRKVDIIPYDANPPTEDHASNNFFNVTYTEVMKGDATTLFDDESSGDNENNLSQRTLLIVWPNNPDREDNPHLYDKKKELPPVWDAECLSGYLQSGGSTVIYVGEREETIQVLPEKSRDCGVSSSRRFQELLQQNFDLVEQYTIPKWFRCADDVTIWKRKTTEPVVANNDVPQEAAPYDWGV